MTMEEIAETDPVDTAERRASYIRTDLNCLISQRDQVLERIEQARASKDDVVLGYASWTAYVVAEFGGQLAELGREDRRDVVDILSQTGMSSRSIAPLVGVTDRQVRRDLDQVGHDVPPDLEDRLADDQVSHDETPDREDRLGDDRDVRLGEDRDLDARLDNALAEISKITSTTPANVVVGMDGKGYPRREPKPRRRQPLNIALRQAAYDLQKVAGRLDRLTADDRFDRLDDRDRASVRNDLARHQKTLFVVRQRLGES